MFDLIHSMNKIGIIINYLQVLLNLEIIWINWWLKTVEYLLKDALVIFYKQQNKVLRGLLFYCTGSESTRFWLAGSRLQKYADLQILSHGENITTFSLSKSKSKLMKKAR